MHLACPPPVAMRRHGGSRYVQVQGTLIAAAATATTTSLLSIASVDAAMDGGQLADFPQPDNQTNPMSWSDWIQVGLLISLIVISIVGNFLVCIAIFTDRRLRKLGNAFIVSLAIADLFVSCLVMPFALCNDLMERWIFGNWFCDAWISIDIMCSTASILNLCAISLDRFIHIKDCMLYNQWMTKKVATSAVVGLWFISVLISVVPIHLGLHKPALAAQTTTTTTTATMGLTLAQTRRLGPTSNSDQTESLSTSTTIDNPLFGAQINNHATKIVVRSVLPVPLEALAFDSNGSFQWQRQEQRPGDQRGPSDKSNYHWPLATSDAIEDRHGQPNIGRPSLSGPISGPAPAGASSQPSEDSGAHSSVNNSQAIPDFVSAHDDSSGGEPAGASKRNLRRSPGGHQSRIEFNQAPAETKTATATNSSASRSRRMISQRQIRHLQHLPSPDQMAKNNAALTSASLTANEAPPNQAAQPGGGAPKQCVLTLSPSYAVVSSSISFYIPCIIMLGLYTKLFACARKHVRNIQAMNKAPAPISLCRSTSSPLSSAQSYTVGATSASPVIGAPDLAPQNIDSAAGISPQQQSFKGLSRARTWLKFNRKSQNGKPAGGNGSLACPSRNSPQTKPKSPRQADENRDSNDKTIGNTPDRNLDAQSSDKRTRNTGKIARDDDATTTATAPHSADQTTSTQTTIICGKEDTVGSSFNGDQTAPRAYSGQPTTNRHKYEQKQVHPIRVPSEPNGGRTDLNNNNNNNDNEDNNTSDTIITTTTRRLSSLEAAHLMAQEKVNQGGNQVGVATDELVLDDDPAEQSRPLMGGSSSCDPSDKPNRNADDNNVDVINAKQAPAATSDAAGNLIRQATLASQRSARFVFEENHSSGLVSSNLASICDKHLATAQGASDAGLNSPNPPSATSISSSLVKGPPNQKSTSRTPLFYRNHNNNNSNHPNIRHHQMSSTSSGASSGGSQLATHKAAITLGIIMGTFLFCWVPFFCLNIIKAFCGDCIHASLFKAFTWLGYANSALNPIIYGIHNAEFRHAFNRIFFKHLNIKKSRYITNRRYSYDLRHENRRNLRHLRLEADGGPREQFHHLKSNRIDNNSSSR